MDFERYLKLRSRLGPKDDGSSKVSDIKYAYAGLLEKEKKDGGTPLVIQKSSGVSGRDTSSPYSQYAIVERDRINAKGENEGTDLEIQSEILQDALCSIIGRHSQIGARADPIIFKKPYYALFHCRHELKRMGEREGNTADQKQQFEWLNEFISKNMKPLEKINTGLVEKGLIDFKHLPIIFEAGSVVVGHIVGSGEHIKATGKPQKTKQPECFLFSRIADQAKDEKTGTKYIELEVLRWGFNGFMFGLTKERSYIKEFAGARKITDLECYPLQYLEEARKNTLIPSLIERGQKWCKYVEATNLQFEGVALSPKEADWSWEINMVPKMMSGRVIMDHVSFTQAFPTLGTPLHSSNAAESGEEDSEKSIVDEILNPSDVWKLSSTISITRSTLWSSFEKETYEPDEAHALLCPATSLGYSLQQKAWGLFDVDLLREVEWADEPITRLEIPEVQKDVLMDLIMEHHTKSRVMDVAEKKGDGLIFMLTGPPGCGKTLTAELMAEEEKRALVRITSSDLGEHPSDVERHLGALLELALRVSAVVLIDEADTFLAKRTKGGSTGDYFHNCIVAIFLKHLEYFPGIIFLTTNLEEDIDPAVMSRVIRLRYGRLEPRGRAKIWRTHLSRAEIRPSEEDFAKLCAVLGDNFDLDGREIKTLANLSLTICRRRKREISEEVVRQLFDLTHGRSVIGSPETSKT